MKKLNIIFSFVLLSFCLFINVSFAYVKDVPLVLGDGSVSNSYDNAIGDFPVNTDITPVLYSKYLNPDDSEIDAIFNERVQLIFSELGFNSYVMYEYTDSNGNTRFSAEFFNDNSVNLGVYDKEGSRVFCFEASNNSKIYSFLKTATEYPTRANVYTFSTNNKYYMRFTAPSLVYFTASPNTKVYNLVYESNSNIYWDGSYYFEEPETPTMPTNADIASAVQMFYNSVYQLPNTAFKDFVVLYDKITGLYTYIGHTRGNALGQVIVEPNGYYEGYKFDTQWWKFFLDEQNDSWDWQNLDSYFNYYVYTSDGTIENLNYVGKSNINGLIEKSGPWATANTVIVYSTNDYPVKYVTFSEDSPDPDIQTGTIQGDQYTYDENLDITDNQYNPLDNFISINYPSTLVGNADFDSFMNTFNENKDVLILPQNANWVILANNSLFSHFSSFIIMCTLFIILQRVMRG